MPQSFSELPTLGEFIERARRFGVRLKQTPDLADGPTGPVRFYYLQRRDLTPFVVLPDLRRDRRLERVTIENWCATLGLPREDFGLREAE
jgi:hypothetical protein